MSYFSSLYYLAFLPAVFIIYNLFPKKVRPFILLIASLIFFYTYSKWLLVFILISALSIYIAGKLLNKLINEQNAEIKDLELEKKKLVKEKYRKKKKLILLGTILFNVAFLFYFKYLGFFTNVFNNLLSLFKFDSSFKIVRHLAPIGISFYTFEAISYIVDVYHEKCPSENNFFKLLLDDIKRLRYIK